MRLILIQLFIGNTLQMKSSWTEQINLSGSHGFECYMTECVGTIIKLEETPVTAKCVIVAPTILLRGLMQQLSGY
jgi:hypothetical protein